MSSAEDIEAQIDDWVRAIGQLYGNVVDDPADGRVAYEAAANLWSEFGYQNAPLPVLRMFAEAIEIGYAAALKDMRDGRFDDEIRQWRPDLNDPD